MALSVAPEAKFAFQVLRYLWPEEPPQNGHSRSRLYTHMYTPLYTGLFALASAEPRAAIAVLESHRIGPVGHASGHRADAELEAS
jgi:hypothetical protein